MDLEGRINPGALILDSFWNYLTTLRVAMVQTNVFFLALNTEHQPFTFNISSSLLGNVNVSFIAE